MSEGGYPPGWYPSTRDRDVLRWWDGERWTDRRIVRDDDSDEAPPRRPRRALPIAIVVALAIPIVLFGGLFLLFATDDSQSNDHDRGDALDDDVRLAASSACGVLRPILVAEGADRVEQIRAGNDGIRALIDTMRELGDEALAADSPAQEWVAGWEELLVAREAFADALAQDPSAELDLPTTSNRMPITDWMTRAGPTKCASPLSLASRP